MSRPLTVDVRDTGIVGGVVGALTGAALINKVPVAARSILSDSRGVALCFR